jgi:hypothetical protein
MENTVQKGGIMVFKLCMLLAVSVTIVGIYTFLAFVAADSTENELPDIEDIEVL